MDVNEVQSVLRLAHETRGTEFKGSGSLKDSRFAAKVVRAALSMANKRNGGYVLIGVSDDHDTTTLTGLTAADEVTWNHDDLADALAKYADPSIEFESLKVTIDGCVVFAIKIQEFDDVPIFCKRDYPEILEKRLYVRSRKKPETAQVGASEDLRWRLTSSWANGFGEGSVLVSSPSGPRPPTRLIASGSANNSVTSHE